ncbi:MAG: 5-dehydro-2-deoxygluconokinase [Ardenticatenaceae bacterium]
MNHNRYDLLTLGRCSLDLFSQQIGAAFVDVESFSTQVGGSPTNIAIGTSRLGLRSAAVTAVGADFVGEFVRRYLSKQGVATDFVLTKAGRTCLAVVSIQPPDNFPLVFYRDDPPDQYINIGDIKPLPLADTPLLLVAGSNFVAGDLRNASFYAAKQAKEHGATVVIDLDLRTSLWPHPDGYSINMQMVWPDCDIVIGTEEEIWAALSDAPQLVWNGQSLAAEHLPTLIALIKEQQHPGQTVVLKRGSRGVTLFLDDDQPIDVAGFPVQILNTVGAGDAFASGLLFARRQGWDWSQAARFANACGAIVVTRHGCSAAMPTRQEVDEFISAGKYSSD